MMTNTDLQGQERVERHKRDVSKIHWLRCPCRDRYLSPSVNFDACSN
jgi:hypothetical protein